MNQKALLKRLEAARAALDAAIEWMEKSNSVHEDSPTYKTERTVLGTCLYCKKPIYAGDNVQRGIHKRCYHRLSNDFIRTEKKTWEQLEQEGKVGPRQKPGRKKDIVLRDADEFIKKNSERNSKRNSTEE